MILGFCYKIYNSKDLPPLNVEWEITDYCNYRCSYCVKKNEVVGLNDEKHILNLDYFSLIQKNLNSFNIPIKYKVTGGEPTSNPYFFDMLKILNEEELRIFTNLSSNLDYIKGLSSNKKSFNISIHLEYNKNDSQIKSTISKIKILNYLGFTISISVIAHPDYLSPLKNLVDTLNEELNSCYINIIPVLLSTESNPYSNEYLKYLNDYQMKLEITTINEDNILSEKTMTVQELEKMDWRGYKCFINLHLWLNKNKFRDAPCIGQTKEDKLLIFSKDFSKIKEEIYKPIICNSRYCNCISTNLVPKIHPSANKDQIKKLIPWYDLDI